MSPPASKPGKRRRWLRLLRLCLMSLVIGLVGLEVLLRVVYPLESPLQHLRGFYRLDGEGRIETNPGWRGSLTIEGRTMAAVTNAQGLRGPDLPAKAAGERRLLVLGDSFTWGLGVEAEEAIPAVLERLLQKDGRKVTAGNAGMWGTGPREWSYTLERHRKSFQPDVVVAICYVGNDVTDSLAGPMSVLDGHVVPSDLVHLMRNSWRWDLYWRLRTWYYLEKLVLQKLVPLQVAPRPSLVPPGIDPQESVFLDLRDEFAVEAAYVQPVLSLMREQFAAFAKALGDTPALVVLLPPHEEIARGAFETLLASKGFPRERYVRGAAARRLSGVLAALGLSSIDLSSRFFAHPDPDSLCLKDWHYNAAGCAQVAEWLLPAVRELLGP